MSGPRLGITTTADRSSRLCQTATEHGLQPVVLPCIEVEPASEDILGEARALAGKADLILVTSPRAISTVWPDGVMPTVEVAAVGQSSARSATDAGGSVVVVGDAGADSLLEDLGNRLSGRSVLFPHGDGADATTPQKLESLGADVSALAVYHTRPIGPGPDPVDAVIFGSPSAVQGWSLSRGVEGLVVGAIGETTAGALAERGCRADIVPPRPDFDLLVALVAEHLTDRSPV